MTSANILNSFFLILHIFFIKDKSFSPHSILHAYIFIPDRQQTLTPSIYLSLGSMLFVSNLLLLCNFYMYSFLFIFLKHPFLQAFLSLKKSRINRCDFQAVVHENASPLTSLQIAHQPKVYIGYFSKRTLFFILKILVFLFNILLAFQKNRAVKS